MADAQTKYKLIILYMLRKVTFPLSNSQITEFMIEKEYTDYFHIQEALNEHQGGDRRLHAGERVRAQE